MSYPIIKHDDKPVKTIAAGDKTIDAFVIIVERSENEDDYYVLYRLRITDNNTKETQQIDLTEIQIKTLKYFIGL